VTLTWAELEFLCMHGVSVSGDQGGKEKKVCERRVRASGRVCVCQYSRMRVFKEGIVAMNNTCVVVPDSIKALANPAP